MSTPVCAPAGWGIAAWGLSPWGGLPITGASAGGPVPNLAPFDIYCVGPCGEMAVILTYNEVSYSPGIDFTNDPITSDLVITSNDGSDAHLYIDKTVNQDYTYEFIYKATSLPLDFTSPSTSHVFIGVIDNATSAAGLFLSQIGIAYGGEFDSAFQVLPNSQTLIELDTYYIIRVAVSTTTSTVYLYVTLLTDYILFGHTLRYILPTIPYSSTPRTDPEGTHIHVKGTAAFPSEIFLDSFCLGNGVLIPNLAPIADAGPDQAAIFCQIVQLNGSASFDPEGAALTYYWRLIDAPIGSMYAFQGVDGTTYPLVVPTGFTNKFYSSGFTGGNAIPIAVGDVLLVAGVPHSIIGTGNDGHGYFVIVSEYELPDSLTSAAYKILKQYGISGATTVDPTFLPDVPGFYKFDLQVFDGLLYSDPRGVVVIDVLLSPLPRGVIPDLSLVWNYLSDFWNLLEDSGRIETLWGGLAQIAATELYTLWQIDYSKSLRDVQRTFIRRWLHYDLLLKEPFVEITAGRFIFRGIDSLPISNTGVNVSGQLVAIVTDNLPLVSITLTGTNPLTPTQIAIQLQAGLQRTDTRFVVTVVPIDSLNSLLRIYAPFAFAIGATTTATSLYLVGLDNQPLSGSGGLLVNANTYKTDISLLGIDIQPNDNLVVAVSTDPEHPYQAVRIAGIADDPSDALRFQRLVILDSLPLPVTSAWSIPSKGVSTQLDFWNGLVESGDVGVWEIVDVDNNTAVYFTTTVVTAVETQRNVVLIDATALAAFLQLPSRYKPLFWGVYRRAYMPIEDVIVDIPNLQRIINSPSESEVLHRNLDYFIDSYRGNNCIRFNTAVWLNQVPIAPVPRLWAEYNYLDNRPTIEANFGIPVQFTLTDLAQLPSTVDYLSAVRGLWYSYLNGPTIFDLRVGTQILLGLPFAEETGTITEIRQDFSTTTGRILIQDTGNSEIVRVYRFPNTLKLEINPATGLPYAVGDTVAQFAPLIVGVEIKDWVEFPNWFQGYLNQGVFYEVEKFFRFLVRVDSAAFNLAALLFAQSFVIKVKPTYTYPLFVVLLTLGNTEVNVSDQVEAVGHLSLKTGAVYGYKQTTILDSPDPGPGRVVGGYPQPWTGSLTSISVNAVDTDTDADYPGNTFPTFPTPDPVIICYTDKPHLSPAQIATALCSQVYAGGTPAADGTIFRTSFPAYTGTLYGFGAKYLVDIPMAGVSVGYLPQVVPGTQTINCCEIFIEAIYDPSQVATYNLQIYKNGVLNQTLAFSYASTTRATNLYTDYNATFVAISVVATDVLTVKLVPVGGTNRRVFWNNFFVTLGTGVALGALGAATYKRLQVL